MRIVCLCKLTFSSYTKYLNSVPPATSPNPLREYGDRSVINMQSTFHRLPTNLQSYGSTALVLSTDTSNRVLARCRYQVCLLSLNCCIHPSSCRNLAKPNPVLQHSRLAWLDTQAKEEAVGPLTVFIFRKCFSFLRNSSLFINYFFEKFHSSLGTLGSASNVFCRIVRQLGILIGQRMESLQINPLLLMYRHHLRTLIRRSIIYYNSLFYLLRQCGYQRGSMVAWKTWDCDSWYGESICEIYGMEYIYILFYFTFISF